MILKRFFVSLALAVAFAAGAVVSPLHRDPAGAQSTIIWKEDLDAEKVCRSDGGIMQDSGTTIVCHDGHIFSAHLGSHRGLSDPSKW